jgi:hypothetical protein
MNFAQLELPTAPVTQAATSIEVSESASRLTRTDPEYYIDFFQAPNPLTLGFEESSEDLEMSRESDSAVASLLPTLGRIDRLEESIYWFLSAATVIYLLSVILTF